METKFVVGDRVEWTSNKLWTGKIIGFEGACYTIDWNRNHHNHHQAKWHLSEMKYLTKIDNGLETMLKESFGA